MKSHVLILGAGASRNYGFPTGYQLAQQLLQIPDEAPYGESMFRDRLSNKKFKQVFKAFIDAGGMSIDTFLATEQGKPFLAVARFAMALIISSCETQEPLLTPPEEDNWYAYLFDSITKNKKWHEINVHTLKVITFNYDRSLERYLYLHLKEKYNASRHEIENIINDLEITHVYGTLGAAVEGDGFEVYQPRSPTDNFYRLSLRLRLIGEENNNRCADGTQSNIRRILEHCSHICFLGFGYDPTNLELLGFPFQSNACIQNIYGTAIGLDTQAKDRAKSLIIGATSQTDIELIEENCKTTLQKTEFLQGIS